MEYCELGMVVHPQNTDLKALIGNIVPRLDPFRMISDEILLNIFSHLEPRDLCVAASVNRKWARVTSDNQLW
jgi:hypothetical protein